MDSKQPLRMVFCGDIMLGAEVGLLMGPETTAERLSSLSPVWQEAKLLIANLECPCVETASPVRGPIPEIIFHAPASRVRELKDAGFSVLTLANNHILNCGPEGLRETVRALDDAGIYHAGAGMNLAEAMQPAFVRAADRIVAFVAFCYGPRAGRFTPGVAPYDPETMGKALSMARTRADLVVAALHDGLEYSDVPPQATRDRFRFLAENGADVVIGHHPHVLQGIEWHGNVPIAYSLGDLLFHNSLPHVAARNFSRMAMGRFAPAEIRRDQSKFSRGAVLTINVAGTEKSLEWHPFRQDPNLRPKLSIGAARTEDLDRISQLTEALANSSDPRHALAEKVWNAAWWADRDVLSSQELINLIRKPKWRYFPLGLKWLARRLKTLIPA